MLAQRRPGREEPQEVPDLDSSCVEQKTKQRDSFTLSDLLLMSQTLKSDFSGFQNLKANVSSQVFVLVQTGPPTAASDLGPF